MIEKVHGPIPMKTSNGRVFEPTNKKNVHGSERQRERDEKSSEDSDNDDDDVDFDCHWLTIDSKTLD